MSKRPANPAPPSPPGAPREVREVTPEMRARSVRTFVGILVAFFVMIGVVVATLSLQGRAVRDYAARVADAVIATHPSANAGFTQPCAQARQGPLPTGAETCDVQVDGGRVTVTVRVQGDRAYRLVR
ncbi:hypothetical protein LAJ19_02765 [Deinococcus taeanensis]|uniref:hypothetical protein n=1 Tax=Deinococcus taeanensis TaxID=2737050 RepID=UPI001CDD29BC|nr:hypothetical protein [Deinococcus taeanensis]UBV43162.1 hypothetical protein LAJ19_02765 [Deinococcus taeanensis]